MNGFICSGIVLFVVYVYELLEYLLALRKIPVDLTGTYCWHCMKICPLKLSLPPEGTKRCRFYSRRTGYCDRILDHKEDHMNFTGIQI